MHILLAIAGVVGGLAFWLIRMNMMAKSARELGDMAATARGAWNRAKFRRKAEGNPLDRIEDPVTAASVLMVAIALCDGDLTAMQSQAIKAEMRDEMQVEEVEETLSLARWINQQVTNPGTAILKLGPFLAGVLNQSESTQLVNMLRRIASVEGEITDLQADAIERLRIKLDQSHS